MLNDSSQGAALLQVGGHLRSDEMIDPIVAVAHDAVAVHLGDLLEGRFRLLARFGHGSIVRRAIRDVALDPRPQTPASTR